MTQEISLHMKCPQCVGTGFFQPSADPVSEPIACNWPGCVDGFIVGGKAVVDPGLDDIMDKANDTLDKVNDLAELVKETAEMTKEILEIIKKS